MNCASFLMCVRYIVCYSHPYRSLWGGGGGGGAFYMRTIIMLTEDSAPDSPQSFASFANPGINFIVEASHPAV